MSKVDSLYHTQKAISKYFDENPISDALFVRFVDAFVYGIVDKRTKRLSEFTEKFLKDNGLATAYANEVIDNKNPDRYFNRSSLSEIGTLGNVRIALLNLSHNKLRTQVKKNNIQQKINNANIKKIEVIEESIKIRDEYNLKAFRYLKNLVLTMLTSINNYEQYFFSKEEDSETLETVSHLEYVKDGTYAKL